MKKKFAKLPKRAKRAAFASMDKDCDLYKKTKSGKRNKTRGKITCKSIKAITKRYRKKRADAKKRRARK